MNVVAVDIRCPRDDVLGILELFGLSAHLRPENRFQASLTCSGTDGAIELRSAQTMKEPAVHRRAIESAQRPAVGIGQNRLAAEFGRDCAKACGDLFECLVPGNTLPDR